MIEVRGLSKRYGATVAVDRLSFDVRPGVVTGFLGPNGAGKSTTMRMVLGLDAPGRRAGLDRRTPVPRAALAAARGGGVAGGQGVPPGRQRPAHLRALAASNGIPRSRVEEVLGLVGLAEVAGRRAGRFSLGMGQRLGIAAALLGDPGVLLLDEPVNGLDPEGIRWVREPAAVAGDAGPHRVRLQPPDR